MFVSTGKSTPKELLSGSFVEIGVCVFRILCSKQGISKMGEVVLPVLCLGVFGY